ncbi:MAG TPA: AAC(3) family N-acetyltransferase, partial [Anaerolineales bacterium]|nr:AAC(3) family N-acetyltransferase [Anaerolineales bacterium]
MLNKKDLLNGFGKIKIGSDTIVVHTSYKSLGGVEGGVDAVIDVMQELVGKDGTVLFPAFNFQSWTETHYFDVMETPSKMGMITEQARLRLNAKRTPHPIYSFSALGAR